MAERSNKRGWSEPPQPESDEPGSNKARARLTDGGMAQEREAERTEGRRGARDVVAMETPTPVEINVRLEVDVLHCPVCFLPLKPPIFQCEGGHSACSVCHSKDASKCHICGRATTYTGCPSLDAFLNGAKVPCPNEAYGCKRYVSYHQRGDHQSTCAHAPCHCPEHGCAFLGSTPMLLDHFTSVHSWQVTSICYGKVLRLIVPPSQRRLLLLGEDQSLFLLAVGACGPACAVSVVCVRANAAAGPRFSCKVWAVGPSMDTKGSFLLMEAPVRSSALSGEFGDKSMFLVVPPQMLHEASREMRLSVRIDKILCAAVTS